MGLSSERMIVEGFDAIRVNTGVIALTLIPELGSKVNSLRDLRSGREWLWRHPRYLYELVPHGSSYVLKADTGGWDECFPSVAACAYPSEPWQGVGIQDHGELWSQASQFEIEKYAETITLWSRWSGLALPYTFTRRIRLNENSSCILVDYEARNTSDQPINYVWSIHPLLAIEPGMELFLPASAQFNVAGSIPSDFVSSEKKYRYPFVASGVNFPVLPETSAGCAVKIWSDPLSAGGGWATLRAKDGEFKMRWDVTALPQVAAWMNFGAWSGDGGTPYYNLGLEPCVGAQDSLADAVTQYDLFATLPPHEPKTWALEIELTS